MENMHITKDVKRAMLDILDHDIVTGKTGSTPEPTDGDPNIWNELQDIFLDPYYAPLLAKDVTNLPQTLVITSELDVLRDEGVLYAHRLKKAGNKVEHFHSKGGFHGETAFIFLQGSLNVNRKIVHFIKEHI